MTSLEPAAAPGTDVTFDVRIWSVEKRVRSNVTRHRVVWTVAGTRRQKTFTTSAAAQSFRAELLSTARRGHPYDVETGLPVGTGPKATPAVTWFELACRYVDAKWPTASPKHRKSIAEAMVTATMAMLDGDPLPADEARRVRSALLNWAFVTPRRASAERPAEVGRLLAWTSSSSRRVDALLRPSTARALHDALGCKLDGTPAAPRTARLKRVLVAGALAYAVEAELLPRNPLATLKRAPVLTSNQVDRRVVINPSQARQLLEAVADAGRPGPRLVAFFACMYYSALRPEEVAHLRPMDLELPAADGGDEQWGWLMVAGAAPEVDPQWADPGGRQRQARALKHRPAGSARRVPAPPQLVALLDEHLNRWPSLPDQAMFRGERGGPITGVVYRRAWAQARRAVLGGGADSLPLARRPYDLRHAAVSTWLSAGVSPAQVAAWAGHGVDVLLTTYASCIDGDTVQAVSRIGDALRQ